MSLKPEIEAFVLSGGKSSRMGRDKGMIDFNGRPMISYVLDNLKETGLSIKIIANNPGYQEFGYIVYKDLVYEKGPLGGLYAALNYTEADMVLLLSCDSPFINSKAIKMLLTAVNTEGITAASVKNWINPLFAVYPVHLKKAVAEAINNDELKMTDFILKQTHTLVPSLALEMPWCFRNINNEQELKEAEEQWNHYI